MKRLFFITFFGLPLFCFAQYRQLYEMRSKSVLSRFRYTGGEWGPWMDPLGMDRNTYIVTLDVDSARMKWVIKEKDTIVDVFNYTIIRLDIDSSYKHFGFQIANLFCKDTKGDTASYKLYITGIKKAGCVSYFFTESTLSMETKYEMDEKDLTPSPAR